MYVINLAGDWGKALFKFSESLVNKLGDNLVMIIGLENEDELVYDSNVLVVVRSKDDETVREIARTALEVNAKYKCSINFHVASENDKELIKAFLTYRSEGEDCDASFNYFKEKLMKLGNVVSVEYFNGYDSNVLVVVRSKDDETVREIARTALEVNAKYKCSINFHVVEENEQG